MIKTEYPFYDIKQEFNSVREMFDFLSNDRPDHPAVIYKDGNNIAQKTYSQLINDIKIAGGIFASEMAPHSKVGFIGRTSYEWIVAFFGAMLSEMVCVPLSKDAAVDDQIELLVKAEVSCVIADSKHIELFNRLSDTKSKILLMNFGDRIDNAVCFNDRFEGEKECGAINWRNDCLSDDVAEIVFTSGSTGSKKGCMLTQRNLIWNAMNGSTYLQLPDDARNMSILPNNHSLGITAEFLIPFYMGITVCINDSPKYFIRNLSVYKPDCAVAVPMVIAGIYDMVINKLRMAGIEYEHDHILNEYVLPGIFNEIRAAVFGTNLKTVISGGAYLDPKYIEFFRLLGISIVQGYGTTECGPVVTCNTDRFCKPESVGKPVCGCEVRIVDGEIQVRGNIVMSGYYNDPKSNALAFEGDWYKTGDLGYFDEDGYLYVTGRKNNIIVLSNGENVSPEEIENRLTEIMGVAEVLVYGTDDGLYAEIYRDGAAQTTEETIDDAVYNGYNKTVPRFKQIKRIVYRDCAFERTVTMKIKRNI